MGQLLEILLIGGSDKVIEQLQLYPVNSLVQLLPIVSTNCDEIVLDDQINCCLQGIFSFLFYFFIFKVFSLIVFFDILIHTNACILFSPFFLVSFSLRRC